jgi:hypothetical protein
MAIRLFAKAIRVVPTRLVRSGVTIALLALLSAPAAGQWQVRSGPEPVALVELFTSQGCSSCPPADHWMSRLRDQPGLWVDYVPAAFHVDYWDYIGWRDPFASAEYSARQRRYARENSLAFVYTPGFLVNGQEWRQWRSEDEPPAVGGAAGILSAKLSRPGLEVRYQPSFRANQTFRAYVALLGFGMTSQVASGENAGRHLRNDFVVLGVAKSEMIGIGDQHSATVTLPQHDAEVTRSAIIVWVSESGIQAPLQAAGGWFEP